MVEEENGEMEFAMLTAEANSTSELVEKFKRKIAPELKSGNLSVGSEIGDKSGVTKVLSIDVKERFMLSKVRLQAYMVFVHQAKGRILVIVHTGFPYSVDTNLELRILDRIMKHITSTSASVEILYDSAWIYDDDEKIREKAVLSASGIDENTAVEKLTDLLKHDRSDVIRESSAKLMGRIGSENAAEVLRSAVRSYIYGVRDRPGVAAACAQALGAMQNREAMDSLNELLAIFTRNKLDAQARTVKQAIHKIEHGSDLEETVCIVCNQPVENGAELLQCPACKGLAQREHLLEWLHVKDYCPNCNRHIDEASFRITRLGDLSSKTSARPAERRQNTNTNTPRR